MVELATRSDGTAYQNGAVGLWHVCDDEGGGKASRLWPGISDINLFGYGEGIVDFDAEIFDDALDLGMSHSNWTARRFPTYAAADFNAERTHSHVFALDTVPGPPHVPP